MSIVDRAILVNREVVLEPDLIRWAQWFEDFRNRAVANTVLNRRKHIRVSTVFLGIDHGFSRKLWFETMVFGTSIDQECDRYATYDEALSGHLKMVKRARQARQIRADGVYDHVKRLRNVRRLLRRGTSWV